MIEPLEDARKWYENVRRLIGMMDRIAGKYWDSGVSHRTLGETLHRDERFRDLEAWQIKEMVEHVRKHLDDIGVLFLFSVFEAEVRGRILNKIEAELETPPSHPVLNKAIQDAKEAVKSGSFGRLTESYKQANSELVGNVDQVRHFRNWVAHGRRDDPVNNVDPESALERLNGFLRLLEEVEHDNSS